MKIIVKDRLPITWDIQNQLFEKSLNDVNQLSVV